MQWQVRAPPCEPWPRTLPPRKRAANPLDRHPSAQLAAKRERLPPQRAHLHPRLPSAHEPGLEQPPHRALAQHLYPRLPLLRRRLCRQLLPHLHRLCLEARALILQQPTEQHVVILDLARRLRLRAHRPGLGLLRLAEVLGNLLAKRVRLGRLGLRLGQLLCRHLGVLHQRAHLLS